ncbi:hypothetical protein [Echinicola sp. 20G]|uniref:hypothetical protein n=1 Tax=Echinicola sp. 20G TaxID=2781961 RepID=UPI001910E2DD|nr:hypothetical protein [Echinicola sp. 20G]
MKCLIKKPVKASYNTNLFEFVVPSKDGIFQDGEIEKLAFIFRNKVEEKYLEILEKSTVKVTSDGDKRFVEISFPEPIGKVPFKEIKLDVVTKKGYGVLYDTSTKEGLVSFRGEPVEYIGVWEDEDGTNHTISGAVYQVEIIKVNG